MLILLITDQSPDEYISDKSWEKTTRPVWMCLQGRPACQCGMRRHGTYERVEPAGFKVARFYCGLCQITFNVLPIFMAARLRGTLDSYEEMLAIFDETGNKSGLVRQLHSSGYKTYKDDRAGLRWLSLRQQYATACLQYVIKAFPERYHDLSPTIGAFRAVLATDRAFVKLRLDNLPRIHRLPAPPGFGKVLHKLDDPPDMPASQKPVEKLPNIQTWIAGGAFTFKAIGGEAGPAQRPRLELHMAGFFMAVVTGHNRRMAGAMLAIAIHCLGALSRDLAASAWQSLRKLQARSRAGAIKCGPAPGRIGDVSCLFGRQAKPLHGGEAASRPGDWPTVFTMFIACLVQAISALAGLWPIPRQSR